jgi:hypothetical protein
MMEQKSRKDTAAIEIFFKIISSVGLILAEAVHADTAIGIAAIGSAANGSAATSVAFDAESDCGFIMSRKIQVQVVTINICSRIRGAVGLEVEPIVNDNGTPETRIDLFKAKQPKSASRENWPLIKNGYLRSTRVQMQR